MTEETFTSELERRAENVHGAPLTFDDVRRKAGSIRRRRRVATGVAAAAVVAVIAAPFAIGGGDPDRSGPEPLPSPPSPSPSQTEPAVGLTPGASVLHDGVLTRPDGSTTRLDVDTAYLQYGVLTDGRVVLAVPGKHLVRVYGTDGQLDAEYDVDLNVITMSADDNLVAWIDKDYHVVVLESGQDEPTTFDWGVPMPGEGFGSIDALFGSDCANGGCTVFVGDFATTTHVLDRVTEPAVPLVTSEPFLVKAISADHLTWAVTFPPGETEQFGCSGIYDNPTDQVTLRNCDTTFWEFSPDGRYATGARGDNGTVSSVEVVEWAAGPDPVLSYDAGDSYIKDYAWADDDHLYVVVVSQDAQPQWSLLRVPVDGGEPEVLAGPIDGPTAEEGTLFALSE